MPVFLFYKDRKLGKKRQEIKKSGRVKSAWQSDTQEDRLRKIAETVCEAEGIELVHVEFLPETSGRILRIYIDRPGGIRLDDCTSISRQIGDILDVYFEQSLSYNLEVSSPGPNRPIGKKEDFARFEGRKAEIRLKYPYDGKKRISGILKGISDDRVNVSVNEEIFDIPLSDISRARLAEKLF